MPEKNVFVDLIGLINPANVSESIYERISYGQDSSNPDLELEKIPVAVVKPTSAREVSEVVRYANVQRIPIYIHGAGTAFKGSPRPKRPGSILLSTEGLTSFTIHEENLYAEIGAGVNQYHLEKMLLQKGYFLPMNMGSKYSATIGGAVSINTVGHMVDSCLGKIIDYVMGLEVVLPNGEIIETGTRSIRRPAGLDQTRFFAGSEGLFGVITKIRMRLLPDFKKTYVVGFFPELADIGYAIIEMYKKKLPPPLYGEFLDHEACRAPFEVRGLGEPKGNMALIMTKGFSQEEADRQAEEIVKIFQTTRASEARIVRSPQEQEDYWAARDNILNLYQSKDGGEKVVRGGGLEAAVPLSHLVDAIHFIRTGHSYSVLHEARLYMYGHIGTCDIHGMWVTPAHWDPSKRMQCRKEARLLESEINLKWGCASGEVGQTGERISFFKKRYGEAAYAMLTTMKKALDPNNILNPGNLEGEGYD
jgi:glycolate oxidase